jgi:RNA polymerase sigma factor (sigma-70 family)
MPGGQVHSRLPAPPCCPLVVREIRLAINRAVRRLASEDGIAAFWLAPRRCNPSLRSGSSTAFRPFGCVALAHAPRALLPSGFESGGLQEQPAMPEATHIDRDQMRNAIASLPERVGTVYRLHLFEELDYGAIAARLGISVSEVERRVAEAIILIDGEVRRKQGGGGR